MDIIQAMAVNNNCYKSAQVMKPAGIVVHSTGANNPNLKRYVDAPEELGVNEYGNHWNTAQPEGRNVCVHGFIGYDINKTIKVAQILPYDYCCWGVGSGTKGSYNYDPAYIQFEVCEDDTNDPEYFKNAFETAAEYCAYLCSMFSLPVKNIVGHYEAHQLGYGSNHGDPLHWMKKHGMTMDDFRNNVQNYLDKETIITMAYNIQMKFDTKEEAEKVLKVLKSATMNNDSGTGSSTAPPVESTAISVGDTVKIKSGSYYYGTETKIPDDIIKLSWVVYSVKGDRAVIDKDSTGKRSIMSAVNINNLYK